MPITIFMNDGNKLNKLKVQGLEHSSGWWNTIVASDFDNDGDIDIMAGNWGLNSRLRASTDCYLVQRPHWSNRDRRHRRDLPPHRRKSRCNCQVCVALRV